MKHVLSIDALSVKITWIILSKLEAKIFRSDFSFVSNFLKMIHVILTESASIERTCLIVKTEKILCESYLQFLQNLRKNFWRENFGGKNFFLTSCQVYNANACVSKNFLQKIHCACRDIILQGLLNNI